MSNWCDEIAWGICAQLHWLSHIEREPKWYESTVQLAIYSIHLPLWLFFSLSLSLSLSFFLFAVFGCQCSRLFFLLRRMDKKECDQRGAKRLTVGSLQEDLLLLQVIKRSKETIKESENGPNVHTEVFVIRGVKTDKLDRTKDTHTSCSCYHLSYLWPSVRPFSQCMTHRYLALLSAFSESPLLLLHALLHHYFVKERESESESEWNKS